MTSGEETDSPPDLSWQRPSPDVWKTDSTISPSVGVRPGQRPLLLLQPQGAKCTGKAKSPVAPERDGLSLRKEEERGFIVYTEARFSQWSVVVEEERSGAVLETPLGPVHVALEGAPRPGRPALLMLPDVGHTHASCFAPLFAHPEMREVASHFLLVHLDPPGMEVGAPPYPPGYQYPSLEQLAEIVPCVLRHLNIASVVGIGVGAGVVLAKFGLLHPEAVEGLVLININPRTKGWVDWVAHKLSGLTSSSSELILAHLFTQEELAGPPPVQQARRRLGAAPNAPLLWAMYNSRGDLGLQRSGANSLRVRGHGVREGQRSRGVRGLLGGGDRALPGREVRGQPGVRGHRGGVGGHGPTRAAGQAHEAFKYFLQGMGYLAAAAMTRLSRSRTASLSSAASGDGGAGPQPVPRQPGGGAGRPPPPEGPPPGPALHPPKSPPTPHPGPPLKSRTQDS
ncbi:LOW QUALITY PROTEIN: protein NDRG2-like [Chlamydotis macqueenii]